MPQNTSDDTERFMQAIAAFSAELEPVTAQGRRIAASSNSVIESVLVEVNETVLRRVVRFSPARGGVLALDVSERRVHRVIEMPEIMQDEHQGLVGKPLGVGDSEAFLSLLNTFASKTDILFARAFLPEDDLDAGFEGLSVKDLGRLAEYESALSSPGTDLPSLVDKLRRDARAVYVQQSGAPALKFGETETVARLESLAVAFAEDLDDEARVMMWHSNWSDDCAIVLARSVETNIALAAPVDIAFDLFAELNRVFVSPSR